MNQAALIGAAGLLAYGAWLMNRPGDTGTGAEGGGYVDEFFSTAAEEAAQLVDTLTMNTFSLSRMRTVTAADVANANVRALLAVIRRGEGTTGVNGYRTLFGGGLFESFAVHPNIRVTRTLRTGKSITSTAAGAYQFLFSTWTETARIMGLTDFTPANQDRGAVGRIAARGALEDAKAGRFDVAIRKIAPEWASMPGSPYGQPVISIETARAVYASAGGQTAITA